MCIDRDIGINVIRVGLLGVMPILIRDKRIGLANVKGIGGCSAFQDVCRLITTVSSVTSPLNSTVIIEVGMYSGVAARTAEFRKHSENDTKCKVLGLKCIPLVGIGSWSLESSSGSQGLFTSSHTLGNSCLVLGDLYGQLSHSFIRGNAHAILPHSCPHSVQQADERYV